MEAAPSELTNTERMTARCQSSTEKDRLPVPDAFIFHFHPQQKGGSENDVVPFFARKVFRAVL